MQNALDERVRRSLVVVGDLNIGAAVHKAGVEAGLELLRPLRLKGLVP